MAAVLRDPALRGKRVFECRNGGYVMFIAEVDFVPDIMMKLARKEILDGCGEDDEGSSKAFSASASGGKTTKPLWTECCFLPSRAQEMNHCVTIFRHKRVTGPKALG